MKKKNILITGCAGFIGSSLAKKLILQKYNLWGIDNLSRGKKENIPKGIKFIRGNCEEDAILEKIKHVKFYAILHFAGQSSGEISFYKPLEDFKNNLYTTIKLLIFSKENKCNHFIYASSMSVYGDNKFKNYENNTPTPQNFYGLSKASSENYIRLFRFKGLNYTILRFFNVYGPGQKLDSMKQGIIRIFFNQIVKNKKLIVKGNKNRIRDFIYIDDVVNIVSKIIGKKNSFNKTFNVSSGRSFKIFELINKLKKIIKYKFKVYYVSGTPLDQKCVSSSNYKIRNLLNIRNFTSLDEGLKKFYLEIGKN